MIHTSEALKLFELPIDTVGKISDADLKRQYRKLVKMWHPDVSGKDKQQSEMMMAKINEAYKLLTDGVSAVNGQVHAQQIVVPTYTHGATLFDLVVQA